VNYGRDRGHELTAVRDNLIAILGGNVYNELYNLLAKFYLEMLRTAQSAESVFEGSASGTGIIFSNLSDPWNKDKIGAVAATTESKRPVDGADNSEATNYVFLTFDLSKGINIISCYPVHQYEYTRLKKTAKHPITSSISQKLTIPNKPLIVKPDNIIIEDWNRFSGNIVTLNAKDIKLLEIETIGDGSCGYRGIDLDRRRGHEEYPRGVKARSRQEQISQLIQAVDTACMENIVINLIAPEIAMFNPDNIVGIDKIGEYKTFSEKAENHYKQQNELEKNIKEKLEADFTLKVDEFKRQHPEYSKGIPLDGLCSIVEAINPDEESNLRKSYNELKANIEAANNNMVTFCGRKDVVIAYLNHILINNVYMELPQESIYGLDATGVVDAIAYLGNVNLVIVSHSGEILHEYEAVGSRNTVYLIYNGRDHYTKGVPINTKRDQK
jgi:hypothetical protein